MIITIWFYDISHVFIILGLFAIDKGVANYVSLLLRKIVISISCTLRNRFRNAASISRNIPNMRCNYWQTVRNRLSEIDPVPQASSKSLTRKRDCNEQSSAFGGLYKDGEWWAWTATPKETECTCQPSTTSSNLKGRMVTIPMPVFGNWLIHWDGYATLWFSQEMAYTRFLEMMPNFIEVSHKQM